MAVKGKQIAEKSPSSSSKRKRDDSDKSDKAKRRNPGVLRFFDVAADVDDDNEAEESDDDYFDDDFMDEVNTGKNEKCDNGKTPNHPFVPKEEELSDGELEMLIEERYKPGSQYVRYADDENKTRGPVEMDSLLHATNDPIIWRVKCTVGRERRTTFCLIQKFVDLQSLGNKLKIASAFSPDHIKGYIYIEAERECDVLEACKGLGTIYSSRISPVPKNEVANLFCVRETAIDILPGTWVRVKLGKYRGDVAQVVAFDDVRKSVVVKIIPRIDLQALGKKVAGGDTVEQTAIPVARLITSKDLEEFRPYIKLRRDRTGMVFETIGGLKLKDGYLFKKVSIESISYVDVVPSADELLKFKPYRKDASDDAEWLSHLYGEQRKKRLSECSKGPNKSSEGTSGAKSGKDFQLHDLVFFGPKDFGVIIGVDSDSFQIIKYDEVEGAELLNVELHEVKRSGIGKKFTTMDQQMKPISINYTVRALEGPFMGRQGVVKHICKGIIFIYDTNQLENGGYFCTKSKWCENISSNDASHESTGNAFDQDNIFGDKGFGGFGDSTSSPKSPQFSKKPWQEKENTHDFNSRRQGDRDDAFSVGQTLRIRVGPLKGHLCRVISIYRSGVTVKVDSQTKVLSVKREHLSEAGVKSNFMKLNNGFGTPGEASGVPAESNVWGSASLTTERSSWSDFSAPDFLRDSSSNTPFEALATSNLEKDIDKGDDPWGSKTNFKKPADSWGNAIGSSSDLEKDKEEGGDPWRSKETSKKATDCWSNAAGFVEEPGKGKDEGNDPWGSKATTSQRATDNWGNAAGFGEGSGKGDDSWRSKESSKTPDSWGNATGTGGDLDKGKEGGDDPWGSKATTTKKERDSWGNAAGFGENPGKDGGDDPWGSKGKAVADDGGWGKAAVVQNTDSWDKGKSVAGDDWGVVTQGVGNNGISSQEDSCGKAMGSWMVKDGSNGNKTEWNQSAVKGKSENDSWNKPKAFGADDGWNSQKGGDSDRGLDWNKGKVNEEASMDNQQDGWNKPRNFDGGRGSGGRRGGGGFRGGNRDQSGRGRSFGRGRSSDWNNESRQTITDFGNSSSSWNNEQSDSWKKNNSFGGDQGSTWGKSSLATDGNSNQGDGLDSKASIWKSEVADTGGNKSSGWASNGAGDAAGNKSSGWGSSSDGAGGNKSSGWASNGAGDAAGNKSSGWGGSGNRVVNAGENKSAGWGSVGSGAAEAGENKSSGWGSSSHSAAYAGENKSSGWGSSSQEAANEGGNKSTGWGSSSQEAANEGGNKATGWGSTCINKSSGWGDSSNGVGNAGGNKSAGWGRAADAGENKPSGWGSSDHAAADTGADTGENKSSGWGSTGRDKSSGWGSRSNWNAQKDSCGSQSSDWNQGAETTNNWRGGKSFRGGRTSGWSSRGSDNDDAGESSQFSNRGRGFGRGGSNRGGFSNRGDSGAGESADVSGRGRGFGRGGSPGSNRGGFGSRGRGRRDQTGDWDRGRSHGDSQSFGGWNKGANDGTGDQVGGWGNQVSGTDGTSSGVGWAGKSTESWSQSNAGGWNRGKPQDNNQSFGGSKAANDDSNDKVGGWGNQGTNKSESWGGKKTENWNQSNAGNWGNQGTNKNEGWGCKQTENLNQSQAGKWGKGGNDDGRDQVGGWSNQVPVSRGTSGSEGWSSKKNESWNQPKAADETEPAGWNSRKGEASGSGGDQAEGAWGKPAVSSWGVDKGGKGGW